MIVGDYAGMNEAVREWLNQIINIAPSFVRPVRNNAQAIFPIDFANLLRDDSKLTFSNPVDVFLGSPHPAPRPCP
jgi:hypothetical protein